MPESIVPLKLAPPRGAFETSRRDAWWTSPALTVLGLGAFLVWANFRVFEGDFYYSGHGPSAAAKATNYLTPFYSPLMFDAPKYVEAGKPSGHAFLATKPAWLPGFVSAAALILIFPAGFRFTCYYYRGAYYTAFWGDPPSCAVGEPRKGYWGEQYAPLILQNIHRFFFYFATIFLIWLAYDVYHALWFHKLDADGNVVKGQYVFGVGVGTLIMAANVYFLSGYTFGCHSLRHLIGGGRDCLSQSPVQKTLYGGVSCLNKRHMIWAWCSLFSVGFTDVYIRFVAKGVWTDYHWTIG